ncbi:MAG: hypothetical protein RL676_1325, partial [Pseudomonadota bacterium]
MTTVFRAKKIYTMNAAMPEATHVAIDGDRIVAVGGPDDVVQYSKTVDERFGNNILMPGFVE